MVTDSTGLTDFKALYDALFDVEDSGSGASKMYDVLQSKPKYSDVAGNGEPQRHSRGLEPQSASDAASQGSNILCSFHVKGECRYGHNCRYQHGNQCPSCLRNVLHPNDPEEADKHVNSCALKADFYKKIEESKDIDCGICYEKPVLKRRKFGLLRGCDHSFCLDCIREWRGNQEDFGTAVRHCPVCRVETWVVIPSPYFIKDKKEREEMFEQYREKLSTIPCRNFNNGDGSCPFSNSCMYAHIDKYGHDTKKDNLTFDANGNVVQLQKEYCLLDFAGIKDNVVDSGAKQACLREREREISPSCTLFQLPDSGEAEMSDGEGSRSTETCLRDSPCNLVADLLTY
eukprot:CAMPEP_0184744184 /NCGR_PEP_ID=MMETSP0315-20130426/7005_1 /TAXON_ID=101924 /ORGANISM="Rhodosorus marinus, Strain UTEX LB 2760" /LENGTH=343 /DNA_ID=CAMNT_0027215821 /DNA_START=724 /DNA_END=1756 /DNA_ORIENTATION=+